MRPHGSILALVAARPARRGDACTAEPTASAGARLRVGARAARRRACADAPPSRVDGGLVGRGADPPTVFPLLISDRITCGPARILLSLLDADNRPVAAPDRTLSVAFYDLGKDPTTPVTTVDGAFTWAIEGERGLYVLDVDLPEAGTWGAEITTAAPGGPAETIRATFEVLDASTRWSRSATEPRRPRRRPSPTSGATSSKISTDTTPDPAFYETSVADALAAHKPFVLVFATPKFCTSAAVRPDARPDQADRCGQPRA